MVKQSCMYSSIQLSLNSYVHVQPATGDLDLFRIESLYGMCMGHSVKQTLNTFI